MAEGFFNQMAREQAKAISAGSEPDDKVNPTVTVVMREEGIDISGNKPKKLTMAMMKGIDRAFTMGCENACPFTTVPVEDWELEDPKGKPIEQVRKIRDEIKKRVAQLVQEMAGK